MKYMIDSRNINLSWKRLPFVFHTKDEVRKHLMESMPLGWAEEGYYYRVIEIGKDGEERVCRVVRKEDEE